jgi:hypothetical protein
MIIEIEDRFYKVAKVFSEVLNKASPVCRDYRLFIRPLYTRPRVADGRTCRGSN